MKLSRIQGLLELGAQLLAHFVGEAVAKLREHFTIEDAPYHLVVDVGLLGARMHILTPVLHVEETQVGIHVDIYGIAPVADLAVETVTGQERLQATGATVEACLEHLLLFGEYLVNTFGYRLVNEFLADDRLCYHSGKGSDIPDKQKGHRVVTTQRPLTKKNIDVCIS